MTIYERNKMNDRERIKRYIESTIRTTCDDITDANEGTAGLMCKAHDEMLKLSKIYKNMGFDKVVNYDIG